MTRHPEARWLALTGLLLGLLPSSGAAAEPSRVVLLPLGEGAALVPTASVAQALARRLKAAGGARVVYFPPEVPEPSDRKSQEKHAGKLLKKAFAAYDQMEYDKVTADGSEALKLFKGLLKQAPSSSTEGYLTCLHLLAASALLQGDRQKASQVMNDAVVFDPRPPSKRLFNPSVQELFEQVRAERPADGVVALKSSPPALAWFNGVLRVATGRVSLRAGLYLVRFYAPGYSSLQRWVRVHPHQERPLEVTLSADGQPETETVLRLREEIRSSEPGPALSQAALDLGADEIMLVTAASKPCVVDRCDLWLHWFKDGRWAERRHGLLRADPELTAAELSGLKVPAPNLAAGALAGVRACTLDDQCLIDERCREGRCVTPRPVTRTWWFWTLVGAGTAAVALAIALPLSRPSGPVIEVR